MGHIYLRLKVTKECRCKYSRVAYLSLTCIYVQMGKFFKSVVGQVLFFNYSLGCILSHFFKDYFINMDVNLHGYFVQFLVGGIGRVQSKSTCDSKGTLISIMIDFAINILLIFMHFGIKLCIKKMTNLGFTILHD